MEPFSTLLVIGGRAERDDAADRARCARGDRIVVAGRVVEIVAIALRLAAPSLLPTASAVATAFSKSAAAGAQEVRTR